jgi:hypothetical protein
MRIACFLPLRLSGQPFLPALLVSLLLPACRPSAGEAPDVNVRGFALNQPAAVYNNWSAYDELSDRVELTEALAMKQFDELLRLRRAGGRFDYYLMDAFWYSRTGGYREFRRPHWPNGPNRWLAACRQHRVKLSLLSFGRTHSFGAMPGEGEPYGFSSVDAQGALYTVVNPSQSVRTMPLPRVHLRQTPLRRGRVLFRDDGFPPRLADDTITLGPEQLAVVGFGEYEVPCSAGFALR